jgi:amino acid adenylation domain-containing protein/non-ribosomal peptide synthase protein (TIGR01720 family)
MNVAEFLGNLRAQGIEVWAEGGRLRYRAPRESLTPETLAELRLRKSEILAHLPAPAVPRTTPVNHADASFPLTHGQKALWFLHKRAPDSAAYHVAFTARVRSNVDVSALSRAFRQLVARHASLRTTYTVHNGEPVQHVHADAVFGFEQIDVAELSPEQLHREIAKDYRRPFDLERGPVARLSIYTRAPDDHVLLLTIHHIACDAWSLWLLQDEWRELYTADRAGHPARLAPLSHSLRDHVAWQVQMLAGPEGRAHWEFWRDHLTGKLPVLNLTTDHPRPSVLTENGASVAFRLPDRLAQQLRQTAKEERCTLYTVLLTAFQILLHRYTGQEDILVGSPTTGRSQLEAANLVGYFVNPVVLRAELSGRLTFRECLQRTRQTVLAAMQHQDYPFPLLVERIKGDRDSSRSPIFQALFALQRSQMSSPVGNLIGMPRDGARIDWGGLALEPFDMPQQEGQFELALEIVETAESLSGVFKYNTDLFHSASIERMCGHWKVLLEGAVLQPTQQVSRLPLLPSTESSQLLTWGRVPSRTGSTETHQGAPLPIAKPKCVHEWFEVQALHSPNAVAVECDGQLLTYQELNTRANRLARCLRLQGVTRNVVVGIPGERSIDYVVGILGILKAGGAYLPLAANEPGDRWVAMLAESRAAIVLAQRRFLSALPAGTCPVMCLDDEQQVIAQQPGHNLPCTSRPDDLVYVMFTSGSTGHPKGIAVVHRGVVRLVRDPDYVQLSATEAILQYAPLSFDASTFEIWGALLNGGRLVIAPPGPKSLAELAAIVNRHQITTLWLTAGLFHQLVDAGIEKLNGLRQLLAGGDVLSPAHVARARAALPNCRVINGYGPTESTTFTCCHPITASLPACRPVPIGRPIAGTHVVVLDSQLELVPIGLPGELYIGGDGLARGYLQRPELTAQQFTPDPFASTPGARLYRSGDLVKWRTDGSLEFLGRLDRQLKIRGFRIEPDEIETVLAAHDAVREAAVVAHGDRQDQKYLVAYVVPERQPGPTRDELRHFLHGRLPDYMVPSTFVTLDSLPLNTNGKVNRHALPAPPQRQQVLSGRNAPPITSTERALADLWSQLLEISHVGIQDNFFALGGHSLLATQVVSRIQQQFEIDLPLITVFESPTIAQLAAAVDRAVAAARTPTTRMERASGGTQFPLSFAQERLWFLNQLEPANPFYNIPAAVRIRNHLDLTAFRRSLQEIIDRHAALRTTFVVRDGTPLQTVTPHLELPLSMVDLTELPGDRREAEVQQRAVIEADAPFDLSNGPLLRAQLLRLTEDEYVLLLTMHHIISDGWSMGVFVRELVELYRAYSTGQESPLAELPVQYTDFAAWQRRRLTGSVQQEHLAYWKQQLADLPALDLPTDFPRPRVQTRRGDHHAVLLAPSLLAALERLNREEGTTLFMCVLAAFHALLHRYTGQDDLAIGSGIANRNRAEVEGLIGFFVNLLVIRIDLQGNPTFRELLRRVRRACLDAFTHQDLPFEMLVRELQPEREANYNPLCRVCLVHQNFPMPALDLPGLSLREMHIGTRTAKFDLTLFLNNTADGVMADVEFNTDLFTKSTIARLLAHLEALLNCMASSPDTTVDRAPLLNDIERRQLLVDWNTTASEAAEWQSAQALFEKQAARMPQAIALRSDDRQLTYGDLNLQANQLAHHLRHLGIGPDVLVAVCADRSCELIVALLGILKAGGAYVPLDPRYPANRLAFMVRDSNAAVLVTQSAHTALFADFPGPIVYLDASAPEEPRAEYNCAHLSSPDHVAYVIYTSGSTGLPKGVAVRHAGLSNLIQAEQRAFQLTSQDRVLQFSSCSFDASVWEIFATLASGATLCLGSREALLPGAELAAYLKQNAVTVATLPPSALSALAKIDLPDLRILVSAGEDCDTRSARHWAKGRRFVNAYGPTEVTVCATMSDCDPEHQRVPIGKPLANICVYVLDPQLEPVPLGVPGELYVGGVGLARGYWRRPELTATRFVPNPFGPSGARLYRTGDRVRWLPDGQLEFLGRIDRQVKLRGFRIELGEIEAVMRQHAAVQEALVSLEEDGAEHKRLAAYFVPSTAARTPDTQRQLLEADRIADWQRLYNDNYRRPPTHEDPAFNIVGWESAYTGAAIPAHSMREWIETTVARILERRPQRVLEVGCGTGLLMFRLAPHCAEYVATDFSASAIEYLERQLATKGFAGTQLRLLRRAADELHQFDADQFDAVVINSVIQYFPSVAYLLQVLRAATRLVRPGGFVFVGDVRCLPLLEVFHTSVQWFKAPEGISPDELRLRVNERLARDQELVIDPLLFYALPKHEPRITNVEVQLKRGRDHNELTKYRYDVILQIDSPAEDVSRIRWRDWQQEGWSTERLRQELQAASRAASGSTPPLPCKLEHGQEVQPGADGAESLREEDADTGLLGFRCVPNSRLRTDLATLRRAHSSKAGARCNRSSEPSGTEQNGAVDPDDLWALGDEFGYKVLVTWSAHPADGNCDVVFHKIAAGLPPKYDALLAPLGMNDTTHGAGRGSISALHPFANNPLERRELRKIADELRGLLRAQLPDHMVPATFVPLDAFPLTPSGKIDRKALCQLSHVNRVDAKAYAAPSTATEATLAEIWREVLGVERIGIQDNFFELGGDSILAIQVVARARDRGLQFSLLQLFQYQKISELAPHVESPNRPPVHNGAVSGPCQLTPIQRWLLEEATSGVHHFNQSLLLETPDSLQAELLRAALLHVVTHHGALRLRFWYEDGEWRSVHGAAADSLAFARVELAPQEPAIQQATLAAHCAQAQQTLDLRYGPLVRAVYFDFGPNRPGRLLLVIHHLVIDALSWRWVLEDLDVAYRQLVRGQEIRLPFQTTSYQAWADRLEHYASSAELMREAPYWTALAEQPVNPLPGCLDDQDEAAEVEEIASVLDVKLTSALLHQVPAACRARSHEVLLTALMLAYYRWCGETRLLLDLESHGRTGLFGDLDVSRTVGWFTSLFPLLLSIDASQTPTRSLQSVKEQLRAIPQDGTGYGMLRYLSSADMRAQLSAQPQAAVVFNYLGQLEERGSLADSPFSLAAESPGPERSPDLPRRHRLEINARIRAGQLHVIWTFQRGLRRRDQVAALADRFRGALLELIHQCTQPDARGFSPSDFPEARLDQAELEAICAQHPDLEDVYELTPTQEGLLFHSLGAPLSGVYVMQFHGRLTGSTAVGAFANAWQQLVERHPVLRTSFRWQDRDRPLQLVHRRASVPLERHDWRGLPGDQQTVRLHSLLESDRHRDFALDRAPLLRLQLIRTGEDEYRFLCTHHHLLLDGWSLPLLLQELVALCEGSLQERAVQLPQVRPFRDYLAWLRKQDVELAESFWRERLAGFASATALEIGRTASSDMVSPADFCAHQVRLDRSLTAALESLARNHQVTLNTLLQGAWALLLGRYSGSADVVFGSTVSGRSAPVSGVESMVGMLINTLPTRVQLSPSERLIPWLQSLQSQQIQAREFEHSALSDIQRWSDVPRGLPLFETLFVFENYPIDRSLSKHLERRLPIRELEFAEQTHYPLTLTIDPAKELGLRIGYDARRFDAPAVVRLLEHLKSILCQLVADPWMRLADVSLLSAPERRQLLVDFNRTAGDYPRHKCVTDLFAQQVLRSPNAVAVELGSRRLTYDELHVHSNRLAHYLRRRGVGRGTRVAVCMQRTPEVVVGLLAILKTGAAYVPLDPHFPDERLRFMLRDAQVAALLIDQSQSGRHEAAAPDIVCVDTEAEAIASGDCGPLPDTAAPDDVAYVIYTSGSTGQPKGVQVVHRALVNFLVAMQQRFSLEQHDALLAVTTISFDIAGLEIYLPLLAGARVVLADRETASDGVRLRALLESSAVTVMQATPATWRMLMDAGWAGSSQLTILVGGEALPHDLARELLRRGRAVWNLYGPTETTIWSTVDGIQHGSEQVTIGRPIANTCAFVLDAHLQPVPVGISGELYLGGDGLAQGYLQRPELTAERFVPHPFAQRPGQRLYKTGDRCRWLADGNLEFLGRLDQQVKIRGFRVEVGDVEAALRQHPQIREAAVSARDDGTGTRSLIAYLVPRTETRPTVSDLREFLRGRLPEYMLPETLQFLPSLPRTANGKLNRRALPSPSRLRPELGHSYEPPRTPIEARLAEIWAEVLGVERVGIHDNFFDLGGASMKAVRLVTKVLQSGLVTDPSTLNPESLFRYPTIAQLSASLPPADRILGDADRKEHS